MLVSLVKIENPTRESFLEQEQVFAKMRSQWPPVEADTVEEKWDVMLTALVNAAEKCLGVQEEEVTRLV